MREEQNVAIKDLSGLESVVRDVQVYRGKVKDMRKRCREGEKERDLADVELRVVEHKRNAVRDQVEQRKVKDVV